MPFGRGRFIPGLKPLGFPALNVCKLRWRLPGSGKRGGLRLIYYFDPPYDTIYLLLVYQKNQQEDLTADQLRILRQLMKEWLHERE